MYKRTESLVEELRGIAPQLEEKTFLLLACRIGDTLFAESEAAKKKVLQRALLSVEDERFLGVIQQQLPELLSEFTSVVLIAQRVVDKLFPELQRVRQKTALELPQTREDLLIFGNEYPEWCSLVDELKGFLERRVETAFQEIDSAGEELEEQVEAIFTSLGET